MKDAENSRLKGKAEMIEVGGQKSEGRKSKDQKPTAAPILSQSSLRTQSNGDRNSFAICGKSVFY